MIRFKKIILPLMLLFACTVNGFSQLKDTITVDLPIIDYAVPQKYLLKDIKISGSNHIPSQLIINSSGLVKGDSIYLPSDYVTNAIQTLWGQRYYSDIQAVVELDDEDVYLELILKERPRVSVWEINGATKSNKKELEERLDFRNRTEMSEFALNNSKDIIQRFYSEKGFLNADIKVSQRNDSLIDNYVIVTFDINRNNKMKIKEINIDGNEELSEKKIKSSMSKTREKTLLNLMKSAKFTPTEFETSKAELVDFLHSKGYRDGAVISDSLYTINEKRVGLNVKINEGNKYYYRDISWVGNTKHDSEVLSRILGINKGDTYDRKTMESRLGTDGQSAMEGAMTVSSIYQNDGHLAFNLEAVETVIEGDSIDIEMRMSEGGQFTINEVVISGNNRTHDRVVRRDLYIRPGELYDQSMLVNSIRQIGNLQHFDPEKAVPDIQPVNDELVDIHFNLEEKGSDQFEFSGGWGSGMIVVSAAIAFNNLSLRRLKEKGAWTPYPAGDNQQMRLSIQTNGTYYQGYSLTFLEPWLGGKKPISLSMSAYYSGQKSGYYSSDDYTYVDDSDTDSRFSTIGVSASIGKRLQWPDPYFQVSGELSYQSYLLDEWSSFLIEDGSCNTISFAGTVSRSSVDQSIYPRRGSEVSLKLTATPPWSLMNKSIDWDDEDLDYETRYKWIEYYKVNAAARFFLPMTKNGKLVLMTSAEFGLLGSYNDNNPSPFEGFSVGGDGVTGYTLYGIETIGLRGYDDDALTPYANYGEQARVYSKWVAELRYPVLMEGSTNVYLLAFAEAGNAYSTWKTFQPFNLKRSLGAGVRLYLPIVGMFGIDWGYGFDTTPSSSSVSGGQIHFSMGQTF
ncbi:MAG: POTRA domain-containing protein [Rikenellaceae bacterium]